MIPGLAGIGGLAHVAAGGGGLSFNADITHWWDVNEGITLSGSEVTAWVDKVAGATFAPVNASFKPDFSATAINGNPGITCLNASEALSTAVATATNTVTYSWVGRLSNVLPQWGRMLSIGNPSTSGDQNSNSFMSLLKTSTSDHAAIFRNEVSSATSAIGTTLTRHFMIVLNGTDVRLYINDVHTGTIANSNALNATHLGVFRELASSGNEDARGVSGDLIRVNRALTSGERTELHTDRAAKFGL